MPDLDTPTNSAAWLRAPYADLEVGPAEYSHPGPGEIVIRNRAVALNPLDSVKQWSGDLMYKWVPYPLVLGEDVAGEVVELGPGVTRFQQGDRVLAYAVGLEKERNHRAEGGFQLFSVVRADLAAPIPSELSFEQAAVLPLAVSTAASALFQKDGLALRHPATAMKATGGTVVVWGGSTSVGSNAVQLAAAAGYDVVATASPKNHDQLRRLGASRVFDYNSPTAVSDIVSALVGESVVGVLAVGTGSGDPGVTIAAATGARRVMLASPAVAFDSVPRRPGISAGLVSVLARVGVSTMLLQARATVRRIRARFVWGSSLMKNEVGTMLWEQYLPAALADGSHVAWPAPLVVGEGLDQVQVGLDRLRAGVSARKLVVTL